MHFGRPLGRLKDTIYFTHSHHSRFLQIADIVVYRANRFEHLQSAPTKWHEIEALQAWNELKQGTDFYIKRWPIQLKEGIKMERPVSTEKYSPIRSEQF